MAKPLRSTPPTSSVARLLDLDAAARATASARPPPVQPPRAPRDGQPHRSWSPAQTDPDRPTLHREVVLTRRADDTFSRLVELCRRSTGTRLTSSHVMRALLHAVAHCLPHIEHHARRTGPARLPSNARGRDAERERFEAVLADALLAGLRAGARTEEPAAGELLDTTHRTVR